MSVYNDISAHCRDNIIVQNLTLSLFHDMIIIIKNNILIIITTFPSSFQLKNVRVI